MAAKGRKKIIITCALTGGVHGKEANPNLPEQPEEIVEQGLAAAEAGAAIIHCHVRTKEGRPCSDIEIFRDIQTRFKQAGLKAVLQFTTGGGIGVSLEDRVKPISLQPEMCSFNMGLLNWLVWGGEHLFLNLRSDLVRIAQMIREAGIKPELECYQLEQLDDVAFLAAQELLEKPYYIDFVMNTPSQGGIKGTPDNLVLMYNRVQQMFAPGDYVLNVCSMGPTQLPVTTMAMCMGMNVRVGMEDNVVYAPGVPVESNAQWVARAVRIAR
jgi:3-keto-5-aminohexanoate cleavage enzyme